MIYSLVESPRRFRQSVVTVQSWLDPGQLFVPAWTAQKPNQCQSILARRDVAATLELS